MRTFLRLALFSIALHPALAAAATEHGEFLVDTPHVAQSLETWLHILVFIVAAIAAVYAVKLAALSQGGAMEKIWNWLSIATVLFALVSLFDILEEVGLIHLEIAHIGLQIAIALILIAVFRKTRQNLLKQVLGK